MSNIPGIEEVNLFKASGPRWGSASPAGSLKGTPPLNTPGIGYLTYYADDMCKKNIAFLRPVLSGELVHSAIILLFVRCLPIS